MNVETVREYCLKKKGVTESFPFEDVSLDENVMNKEQFQEKYKLSLPLKTRKEFEAVRRRMGALTKDEKAILSAIVLQ